MRGRIATISLGLLAWPVAPAAAGQMAAPATAVVNESGRVVRVPSGAPEVIGQLAASPCAEAMALPADAAKDLVARIAAEEGFYPEFVLSVAKIESRYVSTALSDKGAYGLMQLEPDTARRFNVDLCKPADNVRGGIRYLRVLHARYRNPFFILAAYNAGEDAVRKSRGVPPFPETVRFVAEVMNDFYTWPDPARGPKGSTALEEAALPGIVEIGASATAQAATASSGTRSTSNSSPIPSAAAPSWSGGFVLHAD